jgi:hypothetical protein
LLRKGKINKYVKNKKKKIKVIALPTLNPHLHVEKVLKKFFFMLLLQTTGKICNEVDMET